MKTCSFCNKSTSFVRLGKYCDSCYQTIKRSDGIYPLPEIGEIKYSPNKGYPICHICGISLKKILNHVQQKHNITAIEYKKMFGLIENL